MKNNLKNWVFNFVRPLKNKPAGLILALIIVVLPAPTGEIPAIPQEPFLKGRSLGGSSLPGSSFLGEAAAYPVNQENQAPWVVSARGVYVLDVDSMVPLMAKNPDEKLRPASTSKIMTALVAMEEFGSSDILTSKNASEAIGKSIRLKSGEQVLFEDMLYGLLLESGNDVALTLAENYPGGYEAMVEAMNEKAQQLNLLDTTFRNVSGIDQYQHETTVHDLAILTAKAMENNQLAQIVATREKQIRSTDGKVVHSLKNTNELLGRVEGVLGVKTGWTTLAGESLATYVERNGHQVVFVILGSQDRFHETERLINWVFENHAWQDIIPR